MDTPIQYEGFRAIAERAAARGQRPLPIIVGAKAPATKWKGSIIDTDSTEQWAAHSQEWIEECAAKFPAAAVCVLAKPKEFCFIDEDESDQFRKGYEAFSGKSFPQTFTTESRSNHRQSHWRQTDRTRKLGNITQGDLVIASFRQSNLYVLSEGSPHPKGGFYRIVDNTPAIPMPDDLVEFLLDLRRKTREAKAAAKTETSKLAETETVTPTGKATDYLPTEVPKLKDGVVYGKGDRNNRLSQYLYHRWVLQCCSEEELRRDAYQFNEMKCDPALSQDEVEQTIQGKLGLYQRGTGARLNGRVIPWPSDDFCVPDPKDDDALVSSSEFVQKLISEGKSIQEILTILKYGDKLQEEVDRNFPAFDGRAPKKPRMLIDGFLMGGVNFFGSLSGVGKSWLALSVAKALTTGEALLGVFSVKQITPVLYLLAEDDEASFTYRLGLMRMPQNPQLFRYRTISQGKTLPLTDKLTLSAIRYLHHGGKYPFVLVVVDTAIRFMETGRDLSSAANNTLATDAEILRSPEVSADLLFLHHSPKSSGKGDMSLENVLRDTGDFGAMASCVFGLRRDEKLFDYADGPEELDIVNVKMRAPERPKPFRVRLKRKAKDGENGGRPVSVIEETGNLQLIGEGEVQQQLEQRFNAIVSGNNRAGFRTLKDELRVGQGKIKEIAKKTGWYQKPITVFDTRTNKDKKEFIWTKVILNAEDRRRFEGQDDDEPGRTVDLQPSAVPSVAVPAIDDEEDVGF